MRNVPDRGKETCFIFGNYLFLENHAVCEIMWKNMVEPGRPQMTIWRMRTARWIIEATDTNSEYVIVFFIFQGNRGYANGLQCCLI
jgi:hypothetical protein